METTPISVEEYNTLKRDRIDKNLLQEQVAELTAKNKEMGENIVKAKDELKEKHKKEMLELTTEKTALETKVRTFTEKLGVTDEQAEQLEQHLETITADLGNYKQIKETQEAEKQENISKYTEFLNSTNKEGEDFLKSQAEIFGEDIYTNEKALRNFAEARGMKDGNTPDTDKKIQVGKFDAGEAPKGYNSFAEAEQKGDLDGMTNAFFG